MAIQLIGPNGQPTKKVYKVLEIVAGEATVEDTRTGQVLKIHESRIIKESTMALKCDKCGNEFSSKSGLTLHKKKCGGVEKPKQAAKPKKDDTRFDAVAFAKENGGELWTKGVKFDHTNIKVIGHQVIDEKTGYYFSFNTYNGSLGKNGKGITKYPLKGKQITYTVSDNSTRKDSRGEKRTRKGKKTAEAIRKLWTKNGYKKQKV
jgi:hypothetical protein